MLTIDFKFIGNYDINSINIYEAFQWVYSYKNFKNTWRDVKITEYTESSFKLRYSQICSNENVYITLASCQ